MAIILRGCEKIRHPEPRRRRRISKLQALRILRSFVALRRLRMTEDFFTASEALHESQRRMTGLEVAVQCAEQCGSDVPELHDWTQSRRSVRGANAALTSQSCMT